MRRSRTSIHPGETQFTRTSGPSTEDRIAASRRFYNANVRSLNTKVETVPSNIVAGLFHIGLAEYFEADDPAVRAVPQVSFGTPPTQPPPA